MDNQISFIKDNIDVYNSHWKHIFTTNCYAYASLLESIIKDMKTIGLEIRKINSNEKISDDEWKIAVFTVFHAYEFYSE